MNTFEDLKYKFNRFNAFEKIIVINIIVFIVGQLIKVFVRTDKALSYLSLPSDFFQFLWKPWTLITYGFAHYGFFHVLFNLLVLYYISRMLLNLFRPKMALNIYFLGIIVGGLAFLFVYNVFPKSFLINTSGVVGASAGIRALLIFLGVYMAETEVRVFTFNIKLKYIAIALVVMDVLGLFGWNQGGNVAHLGGALLGYLYATKLKQGKDIGTGFERVMDAVVSWFQPKSNLKTVHRNQNKKSYAGKTKQEFHTYNDQKKIDLILDKISKSGYESLTSEEKEFLFKAGKK
ncbi:rhomboid family intramembrane serine protease [Winogradskyella sp.]|jgi:membrane associated rhomboid family serine protease|uniref:rhomboid family protein n=1 Tax=Winogradskyella sp. TaxID=1883156 RepID=UPI0025D8D348|nr:rhomboid family intramembrane serine protease [Winogradskyella sp.]MCT4628755.1 rhomboid family intramembrane serine protease [Winogradskyella sp.]